MEVVEPEVTVEVEVELEVETPPVVEEPQTQEQTPTTDMIVGELKAKVLALETLSNQWVTVEKQEEQRNLLEQLIRDYHQQTMEEVRILTTAAEDLIENERENSENNEEIPAIPEPITQEEPETTTTTKKRPFWL